MSILFGHPTGNPNSYNAAVAYLEAGVLECFCVAWMPSARTIDILKSFRPLRASAQRLERRRFPALSRAPKVQDRVGEIYRLLMRALELDHDPSHQANRRLRAQHGVDAEFCTRASPLVRAAEYFRLSLQVGGGEFPPSMPLTGRMRSVATSYTLIQGQR